MRGKHIVVTEYVQASFTKQLKCCLSRAIQVPESKCLNPTQMLRTSLKSLCKGCSCLLLLLFILNRLSISIMLNNIKNNEKVNSKIF